MASDIAQLEKWFANETFQNTIHAGDPQIAALCQFLSLSTIDANTKIVDFGSGAGLLAALLVKLLSKENLPEYYAVDLEPMFEHLNVPPELQDRAFKIAVEDFYDSFLKKRGRSVSIIVIRNVLHEMSVPQTARLLSSLNNSISKKCLIYVQDLTNLTIFERGHVGWDIECFTNFIHEAGFDVFSTSFEQTGYNGNRWFSCALKKCSSPIDFNDLSSLCMKHKINQRQKIIDHMSVNTEMSKFDVVKANHDIATITYQENELNYHESQNKKTQSHNESIFTFNGTKSDIYADNDFGLVTLLKNKRELDLSALFRSAKYQVLMFGFSQRGLFDNDYIVPALFFLNEHRVDTKILISHPNSLATQLRSKEPCYIHDTSLLSDIHRTIGKYDELFGGNCKSLELRLYSSIPYNSYIFIDDYCYLSLNTSITTGSMAPCIVFKKTGNAINYYEILLNNFVVSWQSSEQAMRWPNNDY